MSEGLAAADRPGRRSGAALRGPEPNGESSPPRAKLDRLWARGRAFLGTDLAIMGGAMTWVSERNLVAAISNAGGFGVIASGSMTPGLLAEEIAATVALTDRPFGVNLITMHPQLTELIDVCVDQHVGHVVLAGGIPSAAAIQRIRAGGAHVVCFAPVLGIAKNEATGHSLSDQIFRIRRANKCTFMNGTYRVTRNRNSLFLKNSQRELVFKMF